MSELISIAADEWARHQARCKALALEKAYLQLVNDMMRELSAVPGLEHTAEKIVRLIVQHLGGTNVLLYYQVQSRICRVDLYGRQELDAVDDPMVRAAFDGGGFQEEQRAFGETQMATPAFTKASCWALPLSSGGSVVGVLKMEGMLLSASEVRRQLEPFFNYAALVLKNQIDNHRRLWEAARLAAIVQSSDDAIIGKDLEGLITSWNAGAERIYGYAAPEMVGRSIAVLVPQGHEDEVPHILAQLREGRHVQHFETIRRRKDGREIHVSLTISPIHDAAGEIVGVSTIARDITERKRAEEAMHRLNRELRAISNCNQTLLRATDEQALLSDVCRIVCDEAGYRMAWVGYAEHDDAKTVRPVAWAGAEDGYLAAATITWADNEWGRGPAGTAVRSGTTACIQDFLTAPQAVPWREQALRRGYRSSIALPLKDDAGSVSGVLSIYSTQPGTFTPDEIRLMEELAGDLAFGIATLRARTERKRAEQRVALLSFALNTVQEAAFLIDEAARFHFVNEAACRTLGYAPAELLSLGVPEIDPEFPMERWSAHWGELRAQRSLRFEGRHRTKDGRLFPVEISANYLEYAGQAYHLALVRDITQRKRVEDALVFVAQRGWQTGVEDFFAGLVRFLCEELDMDYALIDKIDENPDMAETVALCAKGEIAPNLRYALKGTPCENVMGRRLCVYPQGIQQLFPEDPLLPGMGAESYIGIPLWDSTGRALGLIAVMGTKPLSDAASATQLLQLVATRAAAELERERSDRLLRTREHEFRTLAENLPDNVVRYDREGRTVYVNPALERTLGATAARMIGMRIRELNPDGSSEAFAQAVDAALASGKNGEIEIAVPVPSQEPSIHQIRTIVERDEHGEVSGVLAIGRDITERKRAEQEILQLNRELEQRVSERTAQLEAANKELESFAYSVSHDLRAPLRSIDGFSQAVLEDYAGKLDQEGRHYLQRIRHGAQRMAQLIDDMLNLARVTRGELRLERVDLSALAQEIANELARREPGREVSFQAAPGLVVTGDSRFLRVALENLLGNAWKFSSKRPKARIEFGVNRHEGQREYFVRDNGAGFDMNYAGRLFGAFQRLHTTEEYPGNGVGLATVQRIIHRHGGRVWAEGEVDKGATLFFTLPQSPTPEKESQSHPRP